MAEQQIQQLKERVVQLAVEKQEQKQQSERVLRDAQAKIRVLEERLKPDPTAVEYGRHLLQPVDMENSDAVGQRLWDIERYLKRSNIAVDDPALWQQLIDVSSALWECDARLRDEFLEMTLEAQRTRNQ
jgi:TolA-binding protein